ncbi:tetraacyldisaccharide 4'-kinase [Methylobacter sp. S3L5C]|uniref:tetraacyldisaccharide 4'-kinase n=1 Tax=Methylobacter sp. S3L5C TaxID=2839024 RepID=UPI001FACE8E3|nr:tetraacyldisaccharide 4'-kinase [Methylobacter sp. S3L5C]UOA07993.1 tetraacyldisaccharide 4'-kinase [Methylobacter sp. S3L5C]
MKKTLTRWAADIWYKDHFLGVWLSLFGFLFSDAVKFRRFLYRLGVLKSYTLPVPVIVVGNITVGGTGKTPLVIWLARFLKDSGFNPGIISRGYGGQAQSWPQPVTADSDANQVGDEALLIATQTGCPMAVGPLRVEAAKMLLSQADCNVILSDDGLQHYALNRTIEIAVIDGERRFGNGHCLPAGPLREPIERLQRVDFVIVNGEKYEDHEFSMQLVGQTLVNVVTGEQKPLPEFNAVECHALAGIGNPERFFKQLEVAGLICATHSFPDHYSFQRHDIDFGDNKPVLMTEKDAVKCTEFAGLQHWYLPVKAVPDTVFSEQLLNLLKRKV